MCGHTCSLSHVPLAVSHRDKTASTFFRLSLPALRKEEYRPPLNLQFFSGSTNRMYDMHSYCRPVLAGTILTKTTSSVRKPNSKHQTVSSSLVGMLVDSEIILSTRKGNTYLFIACRPRSLRTPHTAYAFLHAQITHTTFAYRIHYLCTSSISYFHILIHRPHNLPLKHSCLYVSSIVML